MQTMTTKRLDGAGEPVIERLTVPLWPDAGRALGLSRNGVYEAVKRNEIPVIRFGRKIVVSRKALERLGNGEAA
jgi:excisionase family DNA binding protein